MTTSPPKPRPRSADPDGLTLRQRRFVQELPLAKSATEAAIKAGYANSSEAAKVRASENVTKSNIAAAIQAQNEAATSAKVMTLLRRKERLSALAEPDPEHPDPIKAIDTLNRMESVYIDRSEVKSAAVIVLVVKGFGGEDDEKDVPDGEA